MKSRQKKEEELKALQSKLPNSQITVITSFARAHSAGSGQAGEKGLSVAQMTQLKRLLREVDSEYIVTKKTLIERALGDKEGLNVSEIPGSPGLVIGRGTEDESYGIAKKIYEFAKKNPALQFFGALVNGVFVDKEQFLEMAKMPPREVLIGRLLGMLTYPMKSLAIVLGEVAKKKKATV
ncbi:MAG: 50S ribosomal protein L10 [Candidatus Yanofskybacteria bacterium RIFCSPHIGHO2_01_FULL_48_25b]|uniref:Large ribosomal subunit protein uL10 n=1 Tax=Candidatus Yanofskybacteria bacterium RIFCSPHIGHO2_01_FULL_48_25b TaxID=1802672 RepID=A0A1F8F098_9BACT|nr:MAG: 50S ribosomal protein L10 [Candidatus Yanofskybacteria bacterium RIFCSPHIGHO2_01_FULL_48_25b]